MPPKTKEQKILARLHRLQRLQNLTQSPARVVETETVPTAPTKPIETSEENLAENYSYVYKDLRKILILASLAIATEIILSLTSSFSFVKLILRVFNI